MYQPELTKEAQKRLQDLLASFPDSTIAGVVVRIGTDAVIVSKEGRMQWFKQDHLGGISRNPKDTDAFGHSIVNRCHR